MRGAALGGWRALGVLLRRTEVEAALAIYPRSLQIVASGARVSDAIRESVSFLIRCPLWSVQIAARGQSQAEAPAMLCAGAPQGYQRRGGDWAVAGR